MRLTAAALILATTLWGAPAVADDAASTAQAASDYSALGQIELTDDQIGRYIGSLDDMQKALGEMPADAAQPDPAMMAKLEGVAKKHGFAGFDEFNAVAGSISLVVDGIDANTKTYVGADKLIAKAIDDVNADTKLSAADKAKVAADLEAQRAMMRPVKYPGNIELVVKHYDEINGG